MREEISAVINKLQPQLKALKEDILYLCVVVKLEKLKEHYAKCGQSVYKIGGSEWKWGTKGKGEID